MTTEMENLMMMMMNPVPEHVMEKLHEWVDQNVPMHTRAAYHSLAHENDRLFRRVVETEMQLRELQDAYHQLQMEAAKGTPFPRVNVRRHVDQSFDNFDMLNVVVQWRLDPYAVNVRLARADPRYDNSEYPLFMGAVKQAFHDQYVPELWRATEESLRKLAPA